MPRSKSLHSYPNLWLRLVEGLLTQPRISFSLPSRRDAINKRQEWHSFLKALQREAEILRARGELGGAQRLLSLWQQAKRHEARLTPLENGEYLLLFEAKEMQPANRLMEDQLQAQLGGSPKPSAELPREPFNLERFLTKL